MPSRASIFVMTSVSQERGPVRLNLQRIPSVDRVMDLLITSFHLGD